MICPRSRLAVPVTYIVSSSARQRIPGRRAGRACRSGCPSAMPSTYSIWLEPGEPLFSEYQIVIDRLALQDGKNVHFTPHVTLVGGIEATLEEATEASRRIASKLSPLELAFNDISCSTTYHQCVFMLAVKTTNLEKAYIAANNELKKECGTYMPHLSLIYSDMTEQERTEMVERSWTKVAEFKFGDGN